MENIRFSIHIPVYNVEKYLNECVESVLKQSFGNFEIILTDDGSTDNSGKICDSFLDSRIRVFHNENQGLLMTRSFSIAKARGEYSVFLDSDDFFSDGFLEQLNALIEEEPCDMVVYSYRAVHRDRVVDAAPPWHEKRVFNGEKTDDFKKEVLFNIFFNPVWTKAIKTSLLLEDKTDFSKYRVCSGEDLLRSLYPVFNAQKVVFVPETWYMYRLNDESITHTFDPERFLSIITVRKLAYSYFEKSAFFNMENRTKFSNVFIRSMLNCVKKIAASDLVYEAKAKSFENIANDDFYKKMLVCFDKASLGKKSRITYQLFSKKQYKLLISAVRMFSK